MEADIRIEAIDHNSRHLETVITIGRANAKTVGFMPKGGFLEYAAKRHILVALSAMEQCVGYLMYRVVSQKAVIVHLCVNKQWRGQHIAKKLISDLINRTKDLYRIELSCRRDYNLDNMWSSFGFVARHNRPGRSKDGKLLTIWQLEHGHPNLLTMLTEQEIGSKLCAVIDTNIFYDLIDDNINRQVEESKSLLADWLQTEVELCLTDEIDNEINLYDDISRQQKLREFATTFQNLTCKQEDFEIVCQALKKYFPEQMTARVASDFRYLARAIAANAQFFITRALEILDKEESIYEEFKTSILHPSDFIIRLDELRRETEYQPVRLAGTLIEKRLVQARQHNLLTEAFLSNTTGKIKGDFQQRLRNFLTDPKRFECFGVWDEKEEPLALIIYDRQEAHELKIPMLRVKINSPISPTILRHLILLSIKTSAQENRQFTRITEHHLEGVDIRAITQDNFVEIEGGWLRANFAIIKNTSELAIYLTNLVNGLGQEYNFCRQIAEILSRSDTVQDTHLIANIERTLYPAKITEAGIPNFIVPIRPEWAENLFDEELAKQNIFGARKELALRREVVYYRSVKNSGGLKAPGRILWYVSQGSKARHYCQVQAIRACSRLEEVVVDTPKSLFRQFRRLGVYAFEDVLKTANNNQQSKVMAIKFSDTEIFNKPIFFEKIKEVLEKNITLQSPYKITEEQFYKLYNEGIFKKRI